MDPLVQRLHDSMKGAYSIERELGGGGMARVFVAEETALRPLRGNPPFEAMIKPEK